MKVFANNVVAEAVNRADFCKRQQECLTFEQVTVGSFVNFGHECLIDSLFHLCCCGSGESDNEKFVGRGYLHP